MKDFLRISWLVMAHTLRHPLKGQVIIRDESGRLRVIDA